MSYNRSCGCPRQYGQDLNKIFHLWLSLLVFFCGEGGGWTIPVDHFFCAYLANYLSFIFVSIYIVFYFLLLWFVVAIICQLHEYDKALLCYNLCWSLLPPNFCPVSVQSLLCTPKSLLFTPNSLLFKPKYLLFTSMPIFFGYTVLAMYVGGSL